MRHWSSITGGVVDLLELLPMFSSVSASASTWSVCMVIGLSFELGLSVSSVSLFLWFAGASLSDAGFLFGQCLVTCPSWAQRWHVFFWPA